MRKKNENWKNLKIQRKLQYKTLKKLYQINLNYYFLKNNSSIWFRTKPNRCPSIRPNQLGYLSTRRKENDA